jgi:3-phenylpropionate/trans-cinnamate dioxygenase alpha subunit
MTVYESKKPFHSMVDFENGMVERQIFADEEIYKLELERIFARAWNFMCHENQIAKPGDFFLSYIGSESVIATRDKTGKLQVFLNSCRHRGNAVCRADQGNTRSFLCTYHGWTYSLEGDLVGVPGYKHLYNSELDKSQWGLVKAGKVASYKGFVFATMDPDAPELEEYLGPAGRMGMDMLAERSDDLVIVNGVQKNLMGCNWKFAVDNLFDFYHGDMSHASVVALGTRPPGVSHNASHRTVMGEYGHAIGGPRVTDEQWDKLKAGRADKQFFFAHQNDDWRLRPEAHEAFGDMMDTGGHANIFPNLWVTSTQLSLRIPRGPTQTEIWWFAFTPKGMDEETRRKWVFGNNHVFGPAGLWEQDDGENWDQSTRAMVGPIAARHPLNFQMGAGKSQVQTNNRGTSFANTPAPTENAQRWTWKSWAEWMDADSWDDLRKNHTDPKSLEVI